MTTYENQLSVPCDERGVGGERERERKRGLHGSLRQPQNVSQALRRPGNYVFSVISYFLSTLCTSFVCVINVFALRQAFLGEK